MVQRYLLLVEKISNTSRQSQRFDTDVDIYRSEIHVIQLIGDSEAPYISQISKMIGITKATVSQIIKRLEKKGLATKYVDEENNTRLRVQLTKKGRRAYQAHVRFHEAQHQEMESFIASLSEVQHGVVEAFLEHADAMISDHN